MGNVWAARDLWKVPKQLQDKVTCNGIILVRHTEVCRRMDRGYWSDWVNENTWRSRHLRGAIGVGEVFRGQTASRARTCGGIPLQARAQEYLPVRTAAQPCLSQQLTANSLPVHPQEDNRQIVAFGKYSAEKMNQVENHVTINVEKHKVCIKDRKLQNVRY